MMVSQSTIEYTQSLNGRLSYCGYCHADHVPGKHVKLHEVERNYITEVFEATGRNITKTVDILGIARSTLHSKLDQYGLRG